MLIQLRVITTKSHIIIKPKFDDLFNVLKRVKRDVNDIVEVFGWMLQRVTFHRQGMMY